MKEKITNFEAISFLLILTIAGIVLSTNKVLITGSKSASILNVFYITILAIVLVYILCLLSKKFIGQNILDISEFLGGKLLKNLVGFAFLSYITFRIATLLRIISITMQNVYYPMTHIIFIIALFCLTAAIICNLKSSSLFKTNSFVFVIIFISMFLIFIGNSKNYNITSIYPIWGDGIKNTFLTGTLNIFSFCGIVYLFFLPSKLKSPEKFTKIAIISIILSGIFLVLCTLTTILLFGTNLSNSDIFPLYLAVRYIEFGTFFQRLDALFLFLCSIGFISVLCFNTYILTSIVQDITNVSDDKPLILPCLFTIFDLSLIIKRYPTIEYLENNLTKIFFLVVAIILPFIILLFANIKRLLLDNEL